LAVLNALGARSEHQGTSPPPHALVSLIQATRPLSARVLRTGTMVNGRLPPEQIQAKVRSNFGKLRMCYEEGLGRDPSLTGRVTVRFVIDREGKVSKVAAGPDTSLPDQTVVDCVVGHFAHLTFPKPEGGIVSVTYPIQFSPE
jgi:Ca-activated chloride channel family protein